MPEKEAEMMTVVDAKGRPVKIARKDWVEKILPQNLQQAKDDPEGLHLMLVNALRDKCASSPAVAEGVKRLQEIDTNMERATVVNGIFLMQTGRAAEAEAAFDDYLGKHGESGAILTNLAKIYHERNEQERAEQTLRRALAVNPNLDNGMSWYASMHRQRGGEEGYVAALRELSNEPKSWRPQLWLARHLLKKKQVDEAMEYYRQVISHGEMTPDGYVQITGDLGTAGELAKMVELVQPIYDAKKHGIIAGLNLVNALAQLGRMDEARAMMKTFQDQKDPTMVPLLADTARRLASSATAPSARPASAKAVARPASPQPTEGRVKVAAVPLLNPVWTPPLHKPQWLVPAKTQGLKIAFFSLADSTRAADQPIPPREPASSRLTRSLPMYLAESLRLRSSAVTVCVLPVLADTGPAVTATPWPLPQMIEACPKEFEPDIVVCGVVAKGARGGRVELHLFRVKDRQPLKTLRIAAADDFTGTAIRADAELMAFLAGSGVAAMDSELKAPGKTDAYLDCLDDLLSHMLAASGVLPAGALRDERAMFDGYFALAKAEEISPLPALIASAGVLAGIKAGSVIAEIYRQALLDLIQMLTNRFDVVRRISPVIYLRLGNNEAYERVRAELERGDDPAYRQWLESLAS